MSDLRKFIIKFKISSKNHLLPHISSKSTYEALEFEIENLKNSRIPPAFLKIWVNRYFESN